MANGFELAGGTAATRYAVRISGEIYIDSGGAPCSDVGAVTGVDVPSFAPDGTLRWGSVENCWRSLRRT